MSSDHQADELDRLIAARRDGERSTPVDPSTEALADLAAALGDLSAQASPPRQDAVWSRVAAGIEAHERERARSPLGRWREWQAIPRAAWGPAIAASVALFAIMFSLISEPTSTSAAFLADVDELSAVTTEALADDVLTADERDSVAELTASLVATIDRRPETLSDLDPTERENVLSQLEKVVAILLPAADAELVEVRSNMLLAAAGLPVNASDRGPEVDPSVGRSPLPQAEATLVPGAPGAAAAGALAKEAVAPGPAAPSARPPIAVSTPSVAASVASLEGVTNAVENAQRGGGPPGGLPGRPAGVAAPVVAHDNQSLCFGLTGADRASCERAVSAAVAACGAASRAPGMVDCERAVELAEELCDDLLSKRDARTCEHALDRLLQAAEREADRHEDDEHSSLESGNITPSDED